MLRRHGRLAQVEQIATEVGEGREPGHDSRQVEDRGGRHVSVLWRHRSFDRSELAGLGLAPDGGEQPSLPDPRFAGEQEELAPAGGDVVETPIGEGQQVVTPDEERTADGPERRVHGREV